MRRCLRTPPRLAASGLVVNGIVLHEARRGSPSHIATGPAVAVFRITSLIASRTSSATLRPERAAALRNAASSFFGR